MIEKGSNAADGAENVATAAVSIDVVNLAGSVAALHTASFVVVWKTLEFKVAKIENAVPISRCNFTTANVCLRIDSLQGDTAQGLSISAKLNWSEASLRSFLPN